MIGDRSGYVAGGTFILVAVNKYVVNRCCCSACYSSRKCYWWHEVMRLYYSKELIDPCGFLDTLDSLLSEMHVMSNLILSSL